ncbi:MAG: hypothetical protein ACMXX9_00985 [Candidatus Woesearchaeota archaeon]
MDCSSSEFYDLSQRVSLAELNKLSKQELIDFYKNKGDLKQFFFSAISTTLTDSESPFVIGYLSDVLADKFLNYDFSKTGRKSMWEYLSDDPDITNNEDYRGYEFLRSKYQMYAELALFHSSFLREYNNSSGNLNNKFFVPIGKSMFKNSGLNSSIYEKKELMNHMSDLFEYYSEALYEVSTDYVWNKKNSAYFNYLTQNNIKQ